MRMTIEHPLKAWLRENRKTANQLCQEFDLPVSTIYRVIEGKHIEPGVILALAIEHATGGDVTVRDIAVWSAQLMEIQESERTDGESEA